MIDAGIVILTRNFLMSLNPPFSLFYYLGAVSKTNHSSRCKRLCCFVNDIWGNFFPPWVVEKIILIVTFPALLFKVTGEKDLRNEWVKDDGRG